MWHFNRRLASVACLWVCGLAVVHAQTPPPSSSSSALSVSGSGSAMTGFMCFGAVEYNPNTGLESTQPGIDMSTWPASANKIMCSESESMSMSGTGGGVSVGSSMSMETMEPKCILFIMLPSVGEVSSGGSASATGSNVGPGHSVGGACFEPSADWATANGISCQEDGLGFSLDGTFAYACCSGDSCNDQNLVALYSPEIEAFLQPNCASPQAEDCVADYAENYGCMVKSVSLPSPNAECAPYLRPVVGCLSDTCTPGCNSQCGSYDGPAIPISPECEHYCDAFSMPLAAPGCDFHMIADGICDPLCFNEGGLFDGGDCLELRYTRRYIEHTLISLDRDFSGTVSIRELDELELCSQPDRETFMKYDIVGEGDGLDVQELYLVILAHHRNQYGACFPLLSLEERASFSFVLESLEEHPWPEVAWRFSMPLYLFADANQDAIVDEDEAMMTFGFNKDEYAFVAGHDDDLAFDHFNDVFGAAIAAMKGEFWDDWDYDMDMAIKVWLKMADYNRDGMVSDGEAMYIGVGPFLFKMLDADESGMLTSEEVIALVRAIAMDPCNGFRVVEEAEGLVVGQLPLLRPSECKLAIFPSWNYAREMEPDMMPKCNATHVLQQGLAGPQIRSRHRKGLYKQSSELMGKRRSVFADATFSFDRKEAKKHYLRSKAKPHPRHTERLATPLRHRRSLTPAHRKLVTRSKPNGRGAKHTKSSRPRRAFKHAADEKQAGLRVAFGKDTDPLEFPFVVSIHRPPMFEGGSSSSGGSGSSSGSSAPLTRRRLLDTSSGSGSAQGSSPVPGMPINWPSYCTGTLIHPEWVLTAAHCVYGMEQEAIMADVVTIGINPMQADGCTEEFRITEVLVHPGFEVLTLKYDVALIKLDGASSYPPVELYDGGDLMYSDCKKLEPLVVGWGTDEFGIPETVLQKAMMEPLAPWECEELWHAMTGVDMFFPDTMMCMAPSGPTTCMGDDGGPLLVPHPEAKTGWIQIGVTSWGAPCGEEEEAAPRPGVYTRVSEVLQWILSIRGMGKFPARSMRMTLDSVQIPPDAVVEVWKGVSEAAVGFGASNPKLLDSLDSKCDAGMTYSDEGEGGMLVTIRTTSAFDVSQFLGAPPGESVVVPGRLPPSSEAEEEEECDLECKKMQGVRASLELLDCAENFEAVTEHMREWEGDDRMMKSMCESPADGGIEGCAYKPDPEGEGWVCVQEEMCSLGNMTWEKVTHMARMGKALTGGLGISAERTHRYDFRTYICIRDWDLEEQLACNVKPKEFACFRFDEINREFKWFGLNSDLKVVKPEAVREALELERTMIAALPPAREM